jgi:glyoxylase-like metal-dependent hydrolase (beta-lactamase superfamily II)
MADTKLPKSEHFRLEELAAGVYAAVAIEGGAAYSNAGIVDLGKQTLVFDTFDSPVAAEDLRVAAEQLTGRRATYVINSHVHSDHWLGNQVFGPQTPVIATHTTREEIPASINWLREIQDDLSELEGYIQEESANLEAETDPSKRAALESQIARMKRWLVTLPTQEFRFPDQSFDLKLVFCGSQRMAELIEVAPGHTNSDAYLVLREDRIMFMGDLGFLQCQPFMVFCEPQAWTAWLQEAEQTNFEVFVPGHGPLGTKADLRLQRQYITLLVEQVDEAIRKGIPPEEVVDSPPGPPFDAWLHGSQRWEANVLSAYERQSGTQSPDH